LAFATPKFQILNRLSAAAVAKLKFCNSLYRGCKNSGGCKALPLFGIFTVSMTVYEIAELAGTSIGTVDRVLHKRGRVAPETKARVEAIIEKYQFTPNPIARRLKRNKSYRFCAFLPRRDQDSGYWGQIINGIEMGADEVKPLGVEITIIEYDRYRSMELRTVMGKALSEEPDGMIFAPINCIKPLLTKAVKKQIPCVFCDSGFPEIKPLCTISQNPVQGGYLAGRLMHLFTGSAEKPVAVLDVHSMDYHIVQRRDGFLRYAREHNFTVIVKEYSEESDLSKRAVSLFLKENPTLGGIFVTNCLAHRLAETAKKKRAGQHFAVIGYDLIPDNRRLLKKGFIDAIISQRPEEQGRQAVVNLYRHIVLDETVAVKIDIPLDISIRENTPEY
jgi:LacI family transcriptional regulator